MSWSLHGSESAPEHDLRARHAWWSSVLASLITALGLPADIWVGHEVPGIPIWSSVVGAAVGVVALGVMIARRRSPTVRLAAFVFLVDTVAVVLALAVVHPHYAAASRPWFPFQANKLGCFIAALLAPTFGVGITAILLHAGAAAAQFAFGFPPELRARVAVGEPWASLVFGVIALVLLVYRVRLLALEREVIVAYAEAGSAQAIVDTMRRLRDIANTPLQTIRLGIAQLRGGESSESRAVLDRMERATNRLAKLDVEGPGPPP